MYALHSVGLHHESGLTVRFRGREPGRRQKSTAEPTTAADLFAKTVARIGGPNRAAEARVFAVWEDKFAALFGKRGVTPDFMRGQTLFLRVPSSSLAHEVTLLRRSLLDALAAELGPDLVTDIRTRVAAADKDPGG